MKKILILLLGLGTSSIANAGLITHTDYTAGSVITAAGQNTNENTIVTEFNGSINSANIAASGVATTNIAANAVTAAKIADNVITPQQMDINLQYGWMASTLTWTYQSASTFTISGDLTDRFQTGDKLKLTQTTVKYFYVCKSTYIAATGLTNISVIGDPSVSGLANAAITSPYWSHQANPVGFPTAFVYTPTFTGWGTVSVPSAYFTMQGRELHVWGSAIAGTVSAAAGTASLPTGLEIDSSYIDLGTHFNGMLVCHSATVAMFPGGTVAGVWHSDATVRPFAPRMSYSVTDGTGFAVNVVNGMCGSNDPFTFYFTFPVHGY